MASTPATPLIKDWTSCAYGKRPPRSARTSLWTETDPGHHQTAVAVAVARPAVALKTTGVWKGAGRRAEGQEMLACRRQVMDWSAYRYRAEWTVFLGQNL